MYLLIKTICYVCIDMSQYLQEVLWSKQYMYVLCSVANALCMFGVYPTCVLGTYAHHTKGVYIALLLSVTSLKGTMPLCAVTMPTAPDSTPCTQSVPIVFRVCMHAGVKRCICISIWQDKLDVFQHIIATSMWS